MGESGHRSSTNIKINLTLLDEIIYMTARVISPVIIARKENSFKEPK